MGGKDPWHGLGGGSGVASSNSSTWPPSNVNLPSLNSLSSSLPSNLDDAKLPSSTTYPSSIPLIPAHFADNLATNVVTALPNFIAGTFAFYSTLALSTLMQGKILRMSTGTLPPVPTVMGALSVAAGGLVAHGTSVAMTSLRLHNGGSSTLDMSLWGGGIGRLASQPGFDIDQIMARLQSGMQYVRRDLHNLSETIISNPAHAVRVATLALLAFKLVGGRFWAISPSSYTNLGSFARVTHSLPAKMAYATSSQRNAIEGVGRRWGCHTCGSRMLPLIPRTQNGMFHADHMPPRSVADRINSKLWRRILNIKVTQRFYPQCVDCSNVQGGILSKATSNGVKIGARKLSAAGGGSAAYNHGLRPRVHHLAGGIVAAATVWDADEQEVVANGNAKRFCNAQVLMEDKIGSWAETFCGWVDRFR